jgi:hypothetical protein
MPCGHACVPLASLPAKVDPIDTATDDHPVAYREPYTPLLRADIRRPESAGARRQRTPHRYQRPTRTGKTRRILAPAAVLHPGPAVCVSSKEDLAELVLTKRCLGVTAVIDLRPQKTLLWPAGVRAMVTDPTRSITTPGTGYERPPSVVAEIRIGATSAAGRAAARECVRRSCCARSPMCHRRW